MLVQVKDPSLAKRSPARAQVEIELCLILYLSSRYEAGDAAYAWYGLEPSDDAVEPPRIDYYVVVCESYDFPGSFRDAAVACAREARFRLTYVAEPWVIAEFGKNRVHRGVRTGRVIDDHHLDGSVTHGCESTQRD